MLIDHQLSTEYTKPNTPHYFFDEIFVWYRKTYILIKFSHSSLIDNNINNNSYHLLNNHYMPSTILGERFYMYVLNIYVKSQFYEVSIIILTFQGGKKSFKNVV